MAMQVKRELPVMFNRQQVQVVVAD